MVSSIIVNVLVLAGLVGLLVPMLYFVYLGMKEDEHERMRTADEEST